MSHIRVLIYRVDDPAADHMTELAAFDLQLLTSTPCSPTQRLMNSKRRPGKLEMPSSVARSKLNGTSSTPN